MKILTIIHNQATTGPYFKVLEMCHELAKSGNDITLLCTSRTARFVLRKSQYGKVEVIEFPDILFGRFRQGIDLWNIINRIHFLRNSEYDIVHIIDCRPVVIFPALWLKKKFNVPLLISWWDLFSENGTAKERSGMIYSKTIGKIETFFDVFFRKYADYSTVVSTYLSSKLIHLGHDRKKIEIIRVGGNSLNFFSTEKDSRKLHGILPDEKVLIYIGSIFKDDLTLLLKSLEMIKNECKVLYRIILVGDHNIEKDRAKYLNINITGRISKTLLIKYLSISNFALLPYRKCIANDAKWPSKVTDYFASGTPLITTPVGDFPKIFKNYCFGIISKSDSPEDFADAILTTFNIDENERKKYSASVKNFFNDELDIKVTSKKYQTIYNKIKK